MILLNNSWLQLLIAGALGVIFTQFAFLGHKSHRSELASALLQRPIGHRGFRGPATSAVVRNLPRLARRDADCVRPGPGAHPLLGHDRVLACAGGHFQAWTRSMVPADDERICTRSQSWLACQRPSCSSSTGTRRPSSTSSMTVSSTTSQIRAWGWHHIWTVTSAAPR